MKLSKTSRILSVFHLFLYCEEVSYKEVTDLMPVSEKTVYRDICLLKQAGVAQPRYSKKRGSFVLSEGDCPPPVFPENQTQKRYLEKIIRLCALMQELDEADDPVAWYRAHYPNLSDRTRQRDFRELDKIGYRIIYQRWNDGDEDFLVGRTYCDFPKDAYDLEIFD